MDEKLLQMLFDANARLNSPEAIAYFTKLAELQRRYDEDIKAMGLNDLDDLAKVQAKNLYS